MHDFRRRTLLHAGLGAVGAGLLAACGGASDGPKTVVPAGPAADRTEQKPEDVSSELKVALSAAPAKLDLGGGVTVATWAFERRTLGQEVRLTAGTTLAAELSNRLPHGTTTSTHWHGIALRNAMDGAPPVTQEPVPAGGTFLYRFTPKVPGTYFLHPHVGVQLDRGLYAPLIVEDPKEPLSYDAEWVVVLDDWLDGVTGTPDDVLAQLMHGNSHLDMGTAASRSSEGTSDTLVLANGTSDLLGGHAGDVAHPHHLVNGRIPADPTVFTGRPGQRARLRIVNAGSDTAYRLALGGHRLTITHTDGYPVEHQQTDALLIGMGERYDVLVTLADGVFPLVALAEGKDARGMALIRTGAGTAPPPTVRPAELDGLIVTAARLRAAEGVRLKSRKTDVTHQIRLTGRMSSYNWAIDGKPFDMAHPDADPLVVEAGQRVRLDFVNRSEMWHPMHLHGHTYQFGDTGPRKDTAIVLPGQTLSVFFDADNPGRWMLHCHNAYHGEAGMMANLAYRT
ncbi:multicopper oxidase family protein [Kitasatospora sp. NPDC050467]|uniref:multicopper oxidase family protein n=1 Tax=unclassified Kitasatospora TaxID=2633591 RepID=UPI00325011D5